MGQGEITYKDGKSEWEREGLREVTHWGKRAPKEHRQSSEFPLLKIQLRDVVVPVSFWDFEAISQLTTLALDSLVNRTFLVPSLMFLLSLRKFEVGRSLSLNKALLSTLWKIWRELFRGFQALLANFQGQTLKKVHIVWCRYGRNAYAGKRSKKTSLIKNKREIYHFTMSSSALDFVIHLDRLSWLKEI